MLVLHGHWQAEAGPSGRGALYFWAEDAQADWHPGKGVGRSRRQGGAAVARHPFAAPAQQVRDALQTLVTTPVPVGNAQTISLRLPSTRQGPLPSPQVLHAWDLNGGDAPQLVAWQLPVLTFDLPTAFAILHGLPADTELTPDVRIAAEVRFWQSACHLVLELIAQQKVLPGLVETPPAAGKSGRSGKAGPGLAARWVPVLDGPRDGPRLAQLARAMPPVCRAQATPAGQPSAPQALLTGFVEEMTDALARQWGGSAGAGQAVAGRAVSGPVGATREWLAALTRADDRVAGSSVQLNRLRSGHQAWLRNLYAAGDRHLRVALRLEAPADGAPSAASDRAWSLSYLLQARDDPSLFVPAPEVWAAGGKRQPALGRRLETAQEVLLTGLGFAARLFEPIHASLYDKQPVAARLTNQEAYTFLREVAPTLEESGFAVQTPAWWQRPRLRVGARLRLYGKQDATAGVAAGLVSLENLVNYRWEIALGDATLSPEEFQAIVALKMPLVQVQGEWVRLDPDQVEAAIRFWEKGAAQGELGLLEALQLGLTAQAVDGLPVADVTYEGWLHDWMQRFTRSSRPAGDGADGTGEGTDHASLSLLPVPAGLEAQLRPYQHYGFSWLDFLRRWGIGACLADDMGLGKTLQTLTLLLHIKEETGVLPGPSLLICPTSVVLNWAQEAARFTPGLRLLVHQGNQRLQGEALVEAVQGTDLVVTSYALVRRDAETLQGQEWLGVILDEAQNIKNARAKQAQIIRSLPARFRLALTGTPVENRLAELWSILHFLNPGFLGSQEGFRRTFALPIERYDDGEARERLRRLITPFILRRVKTDPTVIQDLPAKQESKVYCGLSEEQATLYAAVVQDAMQVIEGAEDLQRRGLVLAMLLKLKQICNHPAQFLHERAEQGEDAYPAVGMQPDDRRSGKIARLAELLEEVLAAGDRALIFTQFASMGHLLRAFFQHRLGCRALFLHGGVPARRRAEMVKAFQEEANGPPLFLLSLKAGGTGLNLTRANHVFHFDRWWNPAVENQATDRAFRIGQTQNVQVHKFVCLGTLEEKIDAMIERKQALATSIVGSGEQWLTELSTQDLRELVALRQELVE